MLIAGAGGFGEALVAGFADAGATTFVIDRDKERLEQLEKRHDSDAIWTSVVDISTRAACEGAVDEAVAAMGGIDVLVHAVGVNQRVAVDDLVDDDWEQILTVNTASCLWLGRAVGRRMRENRQGRIVFFSSVSGLLAHPNHGAYAASKGALNQLLKVMAVEWASYGIGVNAVAPGYALTPLTVAYCAVPGHTERLLDRIPMGRLCAAEDVVGPVLMLASPRCTYVTGQILYVDGGRILD